MRWPLFLALMLLALIPAFAVLAPRPVRADSAPPAGSPAVAGNAAPAMTTPPATAGGDWWEFAPLNLSGSIRGGYWSSDRTLDDQANFAPLSLWLKTAPNFGDGWYGRGDGWIARQQPLDSSSHQDSAEPRADLREGFVGWRNDTYDFTLGRRIIAWGRADRVNPTDVISTRDYTRLFEDDDDLRRGNVVATGSYAFGDLTATALWLPEFRPNIYPVPQLAGLGIRQGTDRFVADQFAVRLERIGHGLDWSMSYFDGVNRNPGASVSGAGPQAGGYSGLTAEAVYSRVRMLGADVATNVGDYGLRSEIAYSDPVTSHGNIFNPRPSVEVVGGIDRNIEEHWNINLQYVLQYVFSYTDPAAGAQPLLAALATRAALVNDQRLRFQHGPTLRVSYTTLNDTLVLEVMAGAFISDRSFMVRPRITYLISDTLKLVTGADIFTGPADSYFGQLRRNTTFLSELRYAF